MSTLDALETLSKFTSPLLIPLPPSPPPKVSIPSRKPKGWISVVPRLASGRVVSGAKDRNVTAGIGEERVVGQVEREGRMGDWDGERVESEGNGKATPDGLFTHHIPSFGAPHRSFSSTGIGRPGGLGGGGKRVISGTMQYALLPPSPPPPNALRPPHRQSGAHKSHLPSRVIPAPERPTPLRTTSRSIPAPPSTASPRSEQLHTPLPGVHYHIPPPLPSTYIPHDSTPDLTPSIDHDQIHPVIHLDQDVNQDYGPDTSFQSVSETQSISDSIEAAEEEGSEGEDEEWVSEVLAEREADEEWMDQVRGQLNALFPDFFAGEYRQPADIPTPLPVDTAVVATSTFPALPPLTVAGTLSKTGTDQPGQQLRGAENQEEKAFRTRVEEGEVEQMLLALDEDDGEHESEHERSDMAHHLLLQNSGQIISILHALDHQLDPEQVGMKELEELLSQVNLGDMSRMLGGPYTA